MLLKEISSKSAQYLGNCIDSFDLDGCSVVDQLPYRDATDLAQSLETAVPLARTVFTYNVNIPGSVSAGLSNDLEYYHDEQNDVFVLYDTDADVHYFFQ